MVSLTPVDPVIQLAGDGGEAEAADFVMVLGPLTRVLSALSAPRRGGVRSRQGTQGQADGDARGDPGSRPPRGPEALLDRSELSGEPVPAPP